MGLTGMRCRVVRGVHGTDQPFGCGGDVADLLAGEGAAQGHSRLQGPALHGIQDDTS